MDTPICLGNGNALNTMGAPFVFQAMIGPLALDDKGYIFDTSLPGLIDIKDFNFPTSSFRIACVHTEEFACEKCSFVATGTHLDCDDRFLLIHNNFRLQGTF